MSNLEAETFVHHIRVRVRVRVRVRARVEIEVKVKVMSNWEGGGLHASNL